VSRFLEDLEQRGRVGEGAVGLDEYSDARAARIIAQAVQRAGDVREHLVPRYAGHILVSKHAHVGSAEGVGQVDEAARLVELGGVLDRVHVVHVRRRTEAGHGEPVRPELLFRLADALGRELRHLGQIHVRQDAAELNGGESVLGREVQNPGPGPRGAAEGGEPERLLWRRLPRQQECSTGCDKLSAGSHEVVPETNF